MEDLNNQLLSKRNILAFLLLALLAVAIPVSFNLAKQQQVLRSKAVDSCPATSAICQGLATYTTCQDDFGYKNGSERFCNPAAGGGSSFRCFDAGNPSNCFSAPDGSYNYSCAGCPNLVSQGSTGTGAPPPTSGSTGGTTTPGTVSVSHTQCPEAYDGRSLASEPQSVQDVFGGDSAKWIAEHNQNIANKYSNIKASDGQSLWIGQGCQVIYNFVRNFGEAEAASKWAAEHSASPSVVGQQPPGQGTPGSGQTPTCPVTNSCCSAPLKTCTSNGVDTKNECPPDFNWCYSGFCISPNYNEQNKTCPTPVCKTGTTYSISGKVTSSGQPVANAKVCLDPPAGGGCQGKTTFSTNVSGDYTISGVTPGGEGHNVYLDQGGLPSQLVKGDVCSNTTVNFELAAGGVGVGTLCYAIAEDPNNLTKISKCTDTGALPYTKHPLPIDYSLKDPVPGKKYTIYVKFISQNNTSQVLGPKIVIYNPAASITEVECHQAVSGEGGQVTIKGVNLGTQGQGKLIVNGKSARVTNWDNATNKITATTDERLTGTIPINLTLGSGKQLTGECTVDTATLSFSALNQCKKQGPHEAREVEVMIYDNTSTSTEPLLSQKVNLDKDGRVQGFTPKLERGRSYTIIVKTANSLAKKKSFTASGGTVNLEPLILPIGNIYPVFGRDTQINNFDASELKRQWSLLRDTTGTGDLNGDGRVNSIDYSCLLLSNTLSDDKFTPATTPTASAVQLRTTGKAFLDGNNNRTLDAIELPGISEVNIKLYKVPDNHIVGQGLTATELVNSQILGQVVSASDGSYDLSVSIQSSGGNFSLIADPGGKAQQGGQMDFRIGGPLTANVGQTVDLPLKPLKIE